MIILVGCGDWGWKQEFSLEVFVMGQVRDDRGLDWSGLVAMVSSGWVMVGLESRGTIISWSLWSFCGQGSLGIYFAHHVPSTVP